MTHPGYIRGKARQLRMERDLTIDEIAERLAISRQTIFHWVRDVPLRKPRRRPDYDARAIENSRRYARLREAAYEQGRREFNELILVPSFRDFVCMYIGEGYKKNRNSVAICNSDLNVVILGDHWIRRFATNRSATRSSTTRIRTQTHCGTCGRMCSTSTPMPSVCRGSPTATV